LEGAAIATSDVNGLRSLLANSARLDSWWKLLADVSLQHDGEVVP
jgi:hypothetical protein